MNTRQHNNIGRISTVLSAGVLLAWVAASGCTVTDTVDPVAEPEPTPPSCIGSTMCDGICTNTNVDPANCGGCGIACADGDVCSQGQCGLECTGGTTECDSSCVNTALDPLNCGGCGIACATDELCSDGQCGFTCVGTSTECSGLCVDTEVDPLNCGGCGIACAQDEYCSDSNCLPVCPSETLCANQCVDTSSDTAHCGGCNVACAQNETCESGVCTSPLAEIVVSALNNGHNGNLGGIAGADALCNQQAAAVNLAGTWRAFLSASNQNVMSFFTGPDASSLPVVNTNNEVLYSNWNALFQTTSWPGTGDLYAFDGKEVDESTGANPEWTDADGWHGSTTSGTVTTNTCNDWTSSSSAVFGTNGEWDFHQLLSQETHACNYTAAVMCVRVAL